MDHLCMPVGDFLVFLDIMYVFIVEAVRVEDYILIYFTDTAHAYEEQYGQVCHVLGIDSDGNTVRHRQGTEL